MDDNPTVDDIFNQIDVNSAAQRFVLAEKFRIARFKDFQKEAIDGALSGKDILIIQQTGKGKKPLLFPAVFSGNTTLVTTPTVSLMQDQTHELSAKEIDAVFFGSAQRDPLAEMNLESPASISYVSPEWLFGN